MKKMKKMKKILNMFNIEPKLLDKIPKNLSDSIIECGDCNINLNHFNSLNDTILIIDNNENIVSFLEEDMNHLAEEGAFPKDTNILSITGSHAAFSFKSLQKRNNGLNVKYAIIDISFGGQRNLDGEKVRLTGVDVYEMLLEYNPDIKFIFYTNNRLNSGIISNKKLLDRFNYISEEDIFDHVLFKTTLTIDKRRDFFKDRLFS